LDQNDQNNKDHRLDPKEISHKILFLQLNESRD